jgi:hypothetical protein
MQRGVLSFIFHTWLPKFITGYFGVTESQEWVFGAAFICWLIEVVLASAEPSLQIIVIALN